MIDRSFETLGLNPDADLYEVKKAYRALAKKNHPDLFLETGEKKKREIKMAEINSAYQELLGLFKEEKKTEEVIPAEEKPKPEDENDYMIYKKGVEFFNKYSGSISMKHRQYNAVDLETLLEKKKVPSVT
jgi:curved DNA-binding protein CbpA